ncbi:MAG: polyprenyl synthetase family protein [Syntrophales bacterium]|nr:polyprenyl synthetase family protein [Syntrophales bacterium]
MNIQEVFHMFRDDLLQVGAWMEHSLASHVELIPAIGLHIIGGGGKRFRPLLLLAAAGLCGYRGQRSYPLCAVIEFIHTATLLHDDVIDNAVLRRGRTSANNIWGNAASVLVGDYLYSKAFKLMTEHGDLAIINLLAETTNVMAEGEVFQLTVCGNPSLSEEQYLTIVTKKTAVLMAAACSVGAMLGGVPREKSEALRNFGMNIGCAFQIVDDTLDYMAHEADFGKTIGKDIAEGKVTLPLIRTLMRCTPAEREQISRLVRDRVHGEGDVAVVMDGVRKYDGINYAMAQASYYVDQGKSSLAVFPDGPYRRALMAIADFVVERNR